jgi:hypothetical protein
MNLGATENTEDTEDTEEGQFEISNLRFFSVSSVFSVAHSLFAISYT